jgi:hypothetical protein
MPLLECTPVSSQFIATGPTLDTYWRSIILLGRKGGIVLTDNLLALKEQFQFQNLPSEVEEMKELARWSRHRLETNRRQLRRR